MKKIFYSIVLFTMFLGLGVAAADKGAINGDLIEKFEATGQQALTDETIINAVTNNNLKNLAINRDILTHHDKFFNLKLKSAGVTNQKSSGRCWLFATLNIFNQKIARQINHKKFELSQPYLTFWDKMEKANMFLENIIKYIDKPPDSREMTYLLKNPFGDGGFWNYTVNLIKKYGAVPISAMPETKQSVATGTVNGLADMKLKQFASELRTMYADGKKVDELRKQKETMLQDIYKLMVYNYGQPPKEFVFRYEDKSDYKEDDEDSDSTASDKDKPVKYISKTYTPESFYEEFIEKDFLEYITLIDYPTQPYRQPYRWEWGNMPEKPHIVGLNLPVSKLKEYVLKMLTDSLPVCFACDVGKGNYNDSGIFSADIYRYDKLLDMEFKMTKEERVMYRGGVSNHMMVIMGVDTTADGTPVKWLVENSWGDERGDKGFWYMYDNWFDEYVFEVYLDKKYLSAEDRAYLEKKPKDLPMWDYYLEGLLNK